MSKRRHDRLWPPGNTEGATLPLRKGFKTRTLVLVTVSLLVVTAGLALYLFAEDFPSLQSDNQQERSVGKIVAQGERPQDLGANELTARDTFGALPNDVAPPDALVTTPLEAPRETAALQTFPPVSPPSAPPPAPTHQPTPVIEEVAPPQAKPQLSRDFVAALRKRAAEALTRNDLMASRLLLQRASAGGDAQALEELARTYDPAVLEEMGLSNIIPGDKQIADKFYKEAQQARASAQHAPQP